MYLLQQSFHTAGLKSKLGGKYRCLLLKLTLNFIVPLRIIVVT